MPNEFRQNLVSGEWVLLATDRAKRPHSFTAQQYADSSTEHCPFEDFEKTGQELVWRYPESDAWSTTLIKNKFPAVVPGGGSSDKAVGPFNTHRAVGFHELFVYRDHNKQLHEFSSEEMLTPIRAFKKRKTEITESGETVRYVSIFHNYGIEAGASVCHPHSQLIATPILPPSTSRSLYGAFRFFKEHGKRVYDVMMLWEKEQKTRMVFENDFFIVFCPFASKHPAEIRIFPKSGSPNFSKMPDEMDKYCAEALSVALRKMAAAYHRPAYNFYIHTAPTKNNLGDIHEFYTWHIEILPKLKIDAGFELGTGIDVNMVDPDDAAELLRNAEV